MKTFSKLIGLTGALLLSGTAAAGPLADYNLILTGDLTTSSNVKVYGKALIGGNLKSSGEFGSHLGAPAFNATNNVEVVGAVDSSNLTIQNGYLGYGTTAKVGNLNCNESGMKQKACVRKLDDVAAVNTKVTDFYTELSANSDFYRDFTTVGTVKGTKLSYTGLATDLVVFNIAGSQLFAQNASWQLDMGKASQVVINVSGKALNNSGSINLSGAGFGQANYSKILWNFHEALSLNLNNGWKGSVLAVDADVKISNDIDGSLAAKSYTGAGQIHHYYWNHTPPKPPVAKVPESSAFTLLLAGLGLLGLTRLRRRQG